MDIQGYLRFDRSHIWHPYTQMKDYEDIDPLFIRYAEGVRLYDIYGNHYYDTVSSWWCNLLGHNVRQIKDAISRQMDELEHTLFAGITHLPAIECAKRLVTLASRGLEYVFFSDNGSTAVEIALKMSYQYWRNIGNKKRKYFLYLDKGYHGDTIGAMSVSGVSTFNSLFKDMFFNAIYIPSPAYDFERSLDSLRRVLDEQGDAIAAIILEPMVQCAGGMLIYKSDFLNEIDNLANRYGFHIILDEIATGFCRTGRFFGMDWAYIHPDFLCLSKSLTNGTVPLAATITTKRVYDAFYEDYEKGKTFFHGHTFTANPIGCVAALATIDTLLAMDWQTSVKTINAFYEEQLKEALESVSFIQCFRHKGVICAFDIDKDVRVERPGWKIYQLGLKHHLILRPLGHTIYLFLPIATQLSELEDIKENLLTVLDEFKDVI